MEILRNPQATTAQMLRPFQNFFQTEASGGVLLLLSTGAALAWANLPVRDSYFDLWHTTITVGIGSHAISKDLTHWINEGLMTVFFFVIGLEIKREVLAGELSSLRKAALPLVAAVGGMVAPALIFAAINAGRPGAEGWGIPMATDIAFALGILAIAGDRVPRNLRLFLTALAIVDDLGAVLVIAIFYTGNIAWFSLGAGLVIFGALVLVNRVGVRHPLVYGVLGVGVWLAFLESGLHATVAGVLVAMTVPARQRIDATGFLERLRWLTNVFAEDAKPGALAPTVNQRDAVQEIESTCRDLVSPLSQLEHTLLPWVAFVIMPLFALANAGISLGRDAGTALGGSVTLGILLGLFVGKQLGITLFTWLAVRFGIATLPLGVSWRQLYGVAILCGIGFTMSLFIADLAFVSGGLLDDAKIGVLAGSIVSGVAGLLLVLRSPRVSARFRHAEARDAA